MKESVIREMTRLALDHGAVNLSQGFPDYDPPSVITEAAKAAIDGGHNQYSVTWGYGPLREKLAEHYTGWLGWDVDPMRHVTVACGVTEGVVAALIATMERGDEALVLEPGHDNYRPAVALADARYVPVVLEGPDYRLDPERLAAAVTPRTKAVLFNTPHNPTGRVFDAAELVDLARFVQRHDLILITDEIYDRLVFDGLQHVCPGSLEALADRTITVSGLGKTFSITGWRLGYVIAPDRFATAVHTVHDFLTICAPTPLQVAAAAALDLPPEYYAGLLVDYDDRRQLMLQILATTGFGATPPQGAYYMLANYKNLPVAQARLDSTAFAHWLTKEVGVAVVPGSSAYSTPGIGDDVVRFAFCKKLETLHAAADRFASAFG